MFLFKLYLSEWFQVLILSIIECWCLEICMLIHNHLPYYLMKNDIQVIWCCNSRKVKIVLVGIVIFHNKGKSNHTSQEKWNFVDILEKSWNMPNFRVFSYFQPCFFLFLCNLLLLSLRIQKCNKIWKGPTFSVSSSLLYPIYMFSSYLGKPTLYLDPFSEPTSYNLCKGLDGVMSTLWVVPSKSSRT